MKVDQVLADLDGSSLALLLAASDSDMAVAVGRASWDGKSLFWEGTAGQFEIPSAAMHTLRIVDRDLDGMTLSVGPLHEGAKESGLYQKTGLTWPKDNQERGPHSKPK